MRKEIIISTVSSILTALILLLIGNSIGIFKSVLETEQLQTITKNLITDSEFKSLVKDVVTKGFHQPARILAVARIQSGDLVTSSTGVIYDKEKGLLRFPNPDNLQIIPVISHINNDYYATQIHYIRSINTNTEIQVHRSPLDTDRKGSEPVSFTVAVFGIQK